MTAEVGQGRVLVVDDEAINALVAEAVLSVDGYEVLGVQSPQEALGAIASIRPDVVLLDVMMPGIDGFQLCRAIREDPPLLPVVFMTALGDTGHRREGLEAGADDFMTKPIDEVELLARVRNLTARSRLQRRLNTTHSVVEAMAALMEARDETTGGHCRRLTSLARRFGESIALDAVELEALQWGGVLHDIGKVAVPDAVLRKATPLTESEWEIMRRHTTLGESVVAPLEGMELVAPIIRSHHERWDGSGYPDSLVGDSIPLLARVFQVVDIYDALRSQRPYKGAMPIERALSVLESEAGTVCDPELTRHFVDHAAELVSRGEGLAPMLASGSR